MANTIKIKRGAKANLPILARGELAYATDTNELFIGVLASPTVVGDNVLVNVDLSAVTQSIIPDTDDTYDLGSASKT
jgi:hypothetical protein